MEFAARLRLAMRKRNIKASVLAYKTGIDKSYISNYLSGRYKPKQDKIYLLAQALRVNEAWLGGYYTDMELEGEHPKRVEIPILGYVAAGIPIDAITDIVDYEELSPDVLNDGLEYFGLKIKGDSMEPKISNGDVVIVRKQSDCDSGQIAIVCINGDEATCKRVMKQPNGIMLVSLNPSYSPMFYSNQEIEELPITILGKVVELRAKFN